MVRIDQAAMLRRQELFAEVAEKLEGKRLRDLLPERVEA